MEPINFTLSVLDNYKFAKTFDSRGDLFCPGMPGALISTFNFGKKISLYDIWGLMEIINESISSI